MPRRPRSIPIPILIIDSRQPMVPTTLLTTLLTTLPTTLVVPADV